jgi:hypothetical protein
MFDDYNRQWDYDVDVDALIVTLDIGDNCVVNMEVGNYEDVDLWLVCCIKPFHQDRKSFEDKWGTLISIGDAVVVSLYYQRWGHSESSYVLLKDSHVVYMHAHLVQTEIIYI